MDWLAYTDLLIRISPREDVAVLFKEIDTLKDEVKRLQELVDHLYAGGDLH